MKRILFLIIFVISVLPVYSQENLSFIYINGSNNNNLKMKNWYMNGVKKLHPILKKYFEKNTDAQAYFNKNGKIKINDEPIIFFWGYKSSRDIDYVKKQIKLTKRFSALGSYFAKIFLTENFHDAIWIQKPNNMQPVIEELNIIVKQEAEKGNDVVLYGYSAGAFVAYEYMFNKLRYINPEEFFTQINADEDIIQFIKTHPNKNTCLSALSKQYADIGSIDYTNKFILNENKIKLKKNLLNLDEMTEKACIPERKLKGVVYFANAMPLFYSDLFDDNFDLNIYNSLLIRHILENGMFMLTVNFREDPLGFSLSKNLTIKEIEQHLNMKINNPSGIIYNNSDVWAFRLFIIAHQCYWSAAKTFAKAVIKSLVEGYKFQYDLKYQKKVKQEHKKKSGL